MAHYTTISEFNVNHPNYEEAIQVLFVSPRGEIHQYIFSVEDWHNEIKPLMTSYVFVNCWHSFVQTIKAFQ